MKKTIAFLTLCLCLLLCSCEKSGSNGSSADHLSVFRILRPENQTSGELIRAEQYPLSPDIDQVQGAVYALASYPSDDTLMSSFPDGVKILSARKTGSEVTVSMSSGYSSLAGIDKTLVDYCITLTMCSLPGVDCVTICVGNEIICSRLRSDDVLLHNTVQSPTEADIRLYFPKKAGGDLSFEYRSISLDEDNSAERVIMGELLLGSKHDRLDSALPEGTVLLSIYTQDGICSVSLSESFYTACEGSPKLAQLWIYSVVNSLTSLSSINSVQILIDGKVVSSAGDCDISKPLAKNERIVGSAVLS